MKYKLYLEDVRNEQLKRACKKLEQPSSISRKRPNDPLRYVKDYSMTNDGEFVVKHVYALDEKAILEAAKYDGFYAACTNLDDDPCEIRKINHERWQIEDAFGMLKTKFKARPVFLQNDDRILAHFLTCFLALQIFKIFLAKVKSSLPKNSAPISPKCAISQLKKMSLHIIPNEGYTPNYTRTDITDAFHKAFYFRTDFKGITVGDLRKIINLTRKGI
ncbi:transposase [Oscillospiraceae bacterium KA00274]|uniref:IS1634 family transposase n=1 Tax=Amygdalobacter nucleatus TaxID=3029274 RepID=UPI0028ED67CB|nr:transposase [Amygdalobacter nucleatus]MDF0485549.1 transposase [Amygdalobacter nucleatus]